MTHATAATFTLYVICMSRSPPCRHCCLLPGAWSRECVLDTNAYKCERPLSHRVLHAGSCSAFLGGFVVKLRKFARVFAIALAFASACCSSVWVQHAGVEPSFLKPNPEAHTARPMTHLLALLAHHMSPTSHVIACVVHVCNPLQTCSLVYILCLPALFAYAPRWQLLVVLHNTTTKASTHK